MKIINKELNVTTFASVSPVVLPAPNRPVNLQMRISAPVTGKELPIILLSHGHGNSNYLSSMLGCAPLADYWAAHGFTVIQPTHLNSKTNENPATVASIQQLTWAYLRTALYPEDPAWETAQESLVNSPNPLAKVDCK